MLTEAVIEQILKEAPKLTIGIVGDLFLDRYLDIDGRLTEPSVETGLDAYQVVGVRSYPGAAGTVINNLATLGVGAIIPISIIGDDGEGYELRRALRALPAVQQDAIVSSPGRRTPTYTKPMLSEKDRAPRELNRLDIKNRTKLPTDAENNVLAALAEWWPKIDALLVLDQVSEEDCGVVTRRVRERLTHLGKCEANKLILADSRERIGLFEAMSLKPNAAECRRATGEEDERIAATSLARRCGRPVFCTIGERGILVADGRSESPRLEAAPGYAVRGPIDAVGAGDSTSAGIACAIAAGASLVEAAAFGNLVASITIQQIGVTGTATPDQVRRRWQEV